MNRDGKNVQKLTPDAMQAGDANWSPDGKRITFIDNFCPCPFASDVFVMNADGSGATQLTSNFGNNLEPGFSPDGRRIVFANFAQITATNCCGPGDVVVMSSVDGSGKTNLTNSPTVDDETPEWGPAGH
jgi:TolB protein